VRDKGEILEFINYIKEISNNINSFIPIYPDIDIEIENIKFSEKYKISAERAGRKIIINIKNSARPQPPSKRRKLTRS
jgi:hypothetical protein